jgi:acyl-CoA dehydrogenase
VDPTAIAPLCAKIPKIGQKAVDSNLGAGWLAREHRVERYFRWIQIACLAPVSPQLILCHIAEHVLEMPKSY